MIQLCVNLPELVNRELVTREKKIAKDRKVIPDPIDDRKFQE